MIVRTHLAGICEKHDVSEAVFLRNDSHSLQAAYRRAGCNFRGEEDRNRTAAEHVSEK